VTRGVRAEPFHLAEVGLAWPPDTFLLGKLTGLAKRGLRITVVTIPGVAGSGPSVPGIEVVRMPDSRGFGRVPVGAALECLRLALARQRRLGPALAATARHVRRRGPRGLLWWLWFYARLAPMRPDVVHFEWESAALRYLELADLWRCPMVLSCHGGLDLYARSPSHAAALAGVGEAFGRAAAVHCVSDAMCAEATRHGLDPSRARVIRAGVDLGAFSPRAG
jgi:glycosyl transferase family 4